VFPVDPVVLHVPVPVATQLTVTEPTVEGTVSATVAVPAAAPTLVTVIV
jgi:hypothetical protein